jgi:hypothetical protein
MPGNSKTGPTTSTAVTFKIIEPLGFSFVGDFIEMSRKANGGEGGAQSNKLSADMILGIKFYGYDVNGVPIKSTDPLFAEFTNGSADQNSVAERYFNIIFTKFEYSIDERSTEYSISAQISSEQKVNGQINGTTKGTVAITGRTVGDFLSGPNGIMEALSKKNEDIKDKGYTQQATKYSVVFLDKNGKPDPNGPIASATLPNNYEVNLEYQDNTTFDSARCISGCDGYWTDNSTKTGYYGATYLMAGNKYVKDYLQEGDIVKIFIYLPCHL